MDVWILSEIIDPLLHTRHNDRDMTEKVGHEVITSICYLDNTEDLDNTGDSLLCLSLYFSVPVACISVKIFTIVRMALISYCYLRNKFRRYYCDNACQLLKPDV